MVELCSTTNFEGDRCEEKLNSSKLSAVGKIEWIPLEFPFSFFFSLTFFFFLILEINRCRRIIEGEIDERESQLFFE